MELAMGKNRRESAQGVSIQPRSPAHPVVEHSRLGQRSIASLFALLALWPGSAAAVESGARAGTSAADRAIPEQTKRAESGQLVELPPPVEAETYEASLAGAYLVAPLLALGVGAALFEVSDSDTVAVAGGALAFLTPAAVHVYHGASEQAGVSFGSMLGFTLLGTVLGGTTGYIVGDAGCDDELESDCDLAWIGPTIIGIFAGGVAGYIGNAIYDVSSNAVAPGAPPRTAGSVKLWLAPTRAAVESKPPGAGALSGLKVGATVNF
jgi:hypothetical protein